MSLQINFWDTFYFIMIRKPATWEASFSSAKPCKCDLHGVPIEYFKHSVYITYANVNATSKWRYWEMTCQVPLQNDIAMTVIF